MPSGTTYKYAIADSVTGQNIVAPTLIPASGGGTVTGSPRVFVLGVYFIIMFTNVITAASHLDYIAISYNNPTATPIAGEIASSYEASTTVSWDGVVYSNFLYIAYPTASGGQSIKIAKLSSVLILSAAHTFTGEIDTIMSLTVDATNPSVPIIWAAYYELNATTARVFAVDSDLNPILAPTTVTLPPLVAPAVTFLNITCTAQNGILTIAIEADNYYGYDTAIPTHFIGYNTVTQAGVVGTPGILLRSVGLASKAFLFNGMPYVLVSYQSAFQPTYFLINGLGQVISRIAYSNGGGYDTLGLPGVTLIDGVAQIAYLIKDFISATAKALDAPNTTTTTNPVYSQTGINLVSFNLAVDMVNSTEIGTNLNLTGGIVSGYDGYTITEQNFFVWPDNVESNTSGTDFYVATYEWADNAGNIFRSAPSIPIPAGIPGSNNVFVPTLRLTYKLANPVKIVVYRWSVLQQIFYAIRSPSQPPVFNDITVDYVTIVDTATDAQILGNPILYTTGGVLEDIAPPSTSIMTLFNNRLWLVDAEDTNLLWYSKQVIESTPVEMSDLLTIFVAPTTGSQGSTGPITALAPMDDKLIIFKKDALGYISGIGPDNTGANSTYSDFTLINSVVGCTNPKSIVFTPTGLMFQSDKGIWLLGRDLSTNYIGAPVETLTTGATVQSALNIPTTNQVRFTLDTGITLMYDYFFGQWGSFVNVPAISSTIYNGFHTYINSLGRVLQETPGQYLDGSSPVLMSFLTGWANLAGLQGFQRFYQLYLLGNYISPFKINIQLAYDYNSALSQSTTVTPIAPGSAWGGDQLWGSGTPWGGPSNVFEARLFPTIQKCESFQIAVNEIYDPSFGVMAGAGLTLSGLNMVVGMKKAYRTQAAARSFG